MIKPTAVTGLTPDKVGNRCVVVGDPKRAERMSELLDERFIAGINREYHVYTGLYKGVKISIASHGVGASGANVLFHELHQVGVSVIIRAGTCGSFGPRPQGSHIVATASVRNDGASAQLVPLAYPGSAHHEVISALVDRCTAHGKENPPYTFSVGVCSTTANLYGGLLKSDNAILRDARVIGEDMENSSLFTLGNIKGIKTGAIMTVDCDVFVEKDEEYSPRGEDFAKGVQDMCKIALDAILLVNTDTTSEFTFPKN